MTEKANSHPPSSGSPNWLCRARGRRRRRERGSSLVEFALVTMLFFFLVFCVFDFSWMFYVQMNLQDAVREAARYASTGNHQPDPQNPGSNLSRVASIDAVIRQYSLGANIQTITISSKYGGSSATGSASAAGGPGDIGTINVSASVPFLTKAISRFVGTNFTFSAVESYKNEPFNGSQTN